MQNPTPPAVLSHISAFIINLNICIFVSIIFQAVRWGGGGMLLPIILQRIVNIYLAISPTRGHTFSYKVEILFKCRDGAPGVER